MLPGYRRLPKPIFAANQFLCLETTLQCGQVFGWAPDVGTQLATQATTWTGVIHDNVVTLWQQLGDKAVDNVKYRVYDKRADGGGIDNLLTEWLGLGSDLTTIGEEWTKVDPERTNVIMDAMKGLRILRQEPFECLVSFICSSNNNISRISQMINKLRQAYGTKIGHVNGQDYFCFPSCAALASANEADLRALGLGYRAKFITKTCQYIQAHGGVEWLYGLRQKSHDEAVESLMQLAGVGRKVADCVALFSLDQPNAVPVDTHVWAIACRDYDSSLKITKSLTPTIYKRVGDLFRERFGQYAGWAHSYMFAAELPLFQSRLPAAMQHEMQEWKKQEKKAAAERKRQKLMRKSAVAGDAAANAGGQGITHPDVKEATAGTGDGAAAAVSSTLQRGATHKHQTKVKEVNATSGVVTPQSGVKIPRTKRKATPESAPDRLSDSATPPCAVRIPRLKRQVKSEST